MACVNPDEFTLAELYTMGKQKVQAAWEHTSAIVATLLNVNRTGGDPVALDFLVPKFDKTASNSGQEDDIITDYETKRLIGLQLQKHFHG